MRKRLGIALICLLLITACSMNLVSKNETKGLNEVLKFTGGHVSLNMDYGYTTEHGKQTTAKIEVSNSEIVKHFAEVPGLIASGVAYTFYNALDSEKKAITEVEVTTEVDEHTTSRYTFTVGSIDSITMIMPEMDKIVGIFKAKQYDSLINMFTNDTSIATINKDTAIAQIKKYDSLWGDVEKFNMLGFGRRTIAGHEVYIIAGTFDRTKVRSQFMIYLLVGKKENYIASITYRIY